MEKAMKFITVSMLLFILLAGCRAMGDQTGQEPLSHERIKKKYYVAAFDEVEIKGVADVVFSQSKDVEIEVEGPESYLPYVVIESRKGVLEINTRRIGNKRVGRRLQVKISGPELKRVMNRGVGNFKINSGLKQEYLQLENYGVGSMSLQNIECDRLDVNTKGVGDLRLSGKVRVACYKASGVGDIKAKELKAEQVTLIHSGVGDVTFYGNTIVDLKSKGIGEIKYYGNQKKVNKACCRCKER